MVADCGVAVALHLMLRPRPGPRGLFFQDFPRDIVNVSRRKGLLGMDTSEGGYFSRVGRGSLASRKLVECKK